MPYLLAENSLNFWNPPAASSFAYEVDWLFNFIVAINVIFAILIFILVVSFTLSYKKSSHPKAIRTATHSNVMEVTWTVIPTLIVIYIFFLGFEGYKDMNVAPANCYDINVTGYKWGWSFTYPNGYSDSNLHVPVNVPIRLIQQSKDVIHSLYIPVMRIKKDVVPGRYNKQWFKPTVIGDYDIFCTAYCGTNHSEMRARCIVSEQKDFDQWMLEATDIFHKHNADGSVTDVPLDEVGHTIYVQAGCQTCHSVDGSKIVGPSWKGSWGKSRDFEDGGSAVFDEAYVRESIVLPAKHIVKGYTNQMPSFEGRFNDRQFNALFAYMKTLGDKPAGGAEAPAPAPASTK